MPVYAFCVRTTIDLNDALLNAAKARATRERKSLKAIVEQALRAFLAGPTHSRRVPPPIPVSRGQGVQPSVDLTTTQPSRT